ncbi:MAG TPA: 23S rRNA (guanosine(2251)-2'-O)-methyltransferase RlmB [Terriglobales bacterium]|nr:23S rRNA (guanosine(2251)-2'-O)-methyltransferase RlmB [Terriglobales bacterium]
MAVIFGINAVVEALKAGGRSFDYVAIMAGRRDARAQVIFEAARDAGVQVRQVSRDQLARLANTQSHQGVVAITSEKQYSDLDDLLVEKRGAHHFLLVLDGVEDPHNLGAIIRTADAAGADGVVIPERRAAGVTGTVTKASAGASEYMPIARVTNVNRTLEELKERNVWTIGLDERGDKSYDEVDYNMDCALVLGAEGAGLHEHVRRKCDFLISIPMLGRVPSLNVSVAAAIVMYEVVRQRRNPLSKPKKS